MSMLGSSCSPCCGKCETASLSSFGPGTAVDTYSFPSAPGRVRFYYTSNTAPSSFTVSGQNVTRFTTPSPVVGSYLAEFFKTSGTTTLSVTVSAGSGAEWSYTLECPEQLYAIALTGMQSIPWTRTIWSPDKYNATFINIDEISTDFFIACPNNTFIGCTGSFAANLTTPVRFLFFDTATENNHVDHPTRTNTMLRIEPADPFDALSPQWRVFQEIGTPNIYSATVGTLVELPSVTATLWTKDSFNEEEHGTLVSPPTPSSTATPVSRYCGFDVEEADFGPFDVLVQLQVVEYESRPGVAEYEAFLEEVQQWVDAENEAVFTTQSAGICARESVPNFFGDFPIFISGPLGPFGTQAHNPVGIQTASGFNVLYRPDFPAGWATGSAISGSNSVSWSKAVPGVIELNCRGPFGQPVVLTDFSSSGQVRVGKFYGPSVGWARVELVLISITVSQS